MFGKSGIGMAARVLRPLRSRSERSFTAFCFHDVTDTPTEFHREHGLAVSPDVFREQIAWITSNFDVVHPDVLGDDRRLSRRAALVTFDDGFLGSFVEGIGWLAR